MEALIKYLQTPTKTGTLMKERGHASANQERFHVSHELRTRIWSLMRRLYRRRTCLNIVIIRVCTQAIPNLAG